MREYGTPATLAGPSGSLADDVLRHVRRDPSTVLFLREHQGQWREITAGRFRREVEAVARGLIASGVQHGDRVGLIASTRYEWTLVDYACWWIGAVTVPVYPSRSSDDAAALLADCGAVACVVETAGRAADLRDRADTPALAHVWALDEGGTESLALAGHAVGADVLERRRAAVGPDDLATVLYTSGTTGRPKGCCLTHANLHVEAVETTAALEELFADPDAQTLLFLPLAHVFARIAQVGCVHTGTPMGHSSDVNALVRAVAGLRPTFVLGIPRVFEQVFTGASQQARIVGRRRVFDAAVTTAIAWSRALDDGGPSLLLRARHRAYERLVYAPLRRRLGGRVRHAISGGAPMGERLTHFFRGVGVPVLEGYGLTESTGALAVNTPAELKIGTVGRPVPGTTVRVADDGELLVRGGQVFAGYWADDEATERVLAGGWLHTGDLGEIDAEGFVRVTGRKQEVLVTAGGKTVSPAVLEEQVRTHPLVSQCLVVGDGRPYVAALLTLEAEAVRTWAERTGRPAATSEAHDDPALLAELQGVVDRANAGVSPAEAIRRFAALPVEWTEEAGHLTPTQRLRRSRVLADFRAEVDALYA